MISDGRGATGIGFQTALALLRKNAKVYIASRSKSKFDVAVQQTHGILDESQRANIRFLQLDLSSISDCVEAAGRFLVLEQRLDVVIANAALSLMVR